MDVKAIAAQIKETTPDAEEFMRTLGQVTWLLTLSKEHRSKSISYIETQVSAALMFKQIRVYTKGNQPIAAVLWAYASEDVKRKIDAGDANMSLQDWRSGQELTIVESISPLMDKDIFIEQFLNSVKK
eukprot:TRINITY_DN3613_c1_g1_i2.p1 TRINITY_DN3613_c1_g1~~TRINITY_DN3613_c1_g1_i2.p1  ORF type:complete len:128 (-),score=7.13 TRINITY_DN3613_c1_g1_i2:321-704(-)